MQAKLELARTKLLYSQPLYALMLQRCSICWDQSVETAGVCTKSDGTIQLAISPEFWEVLPIEHCIGVLTHEMLHLFMDHFRRGKDLDKRLANIAMDIAINQYIKPENLPEFALYPAKFDLPDGLNFERYYALLKNEQGKQPEDGDQPLDDHGYGADQSQGQVSDEIAHSATAEAANDALKECQVKFPGKIPHHVETAIQTLNAKAKLNWKLELRKFIGRERSKEIEYTRARPNRRMGFSAEGVKATYFPKICVAIDESGSVNTDTHARFFAEIKAILKNADGNTEILHFDTTIAKRETLRSARGLSYTRYASGGTDFNCVIEHARRTRPDLLIVLTDGEAPTPTIDCKVPTLWVLTGGNDGKHLKGIKAVID